MAKHIYHLNFRATRLRDSSFPDTVTFACDESNLSSLVADIAGAVTSQHVSTFMQLQGRGVGAYPVGKRRTVAAVLKDVNDSLFKFRLRNLKDTSDMEGVVALLQGTAYSGDGEPVSALTAPPALPNTLSPVALISPAFTTKSS